MKILIVEDQTQTLHFLEHLCLGIYPKSQIFLVKIQVDAIKILETQNIDLVITDLDFDGEKRFFAVKRAMELNIPCIIYSGFYKPTFVRKAIDLQVKGYVCKLGKIEDLKFILENFETHIAYTCSFISKQSEKSNLTDVQELILTPSEQKILQLLIQGSERKLIANKLNIKQSTLNSYIQDIKVRNNLSLAELVRNYVYWFSQ